MTVELVEETLAQLGAGDVVHPAEATLANATALAESWSREEAPSGEAGTALDPWRPELEALLAVALPTSVYGGPVGERAAIAALRTLGREQAHHETEPVSGPTAGLSLHHVLWAAAAYALANDRADLLPAMAEVQVESRLGRGGPVFGVDRVRHALARGADRTYEDCRLWLLGLDLRRALACWRRDSDAEASLAEAELLTALVAARKEPDRTYSEVIGRDRVPEARLRARLETRSARDDLARLFGVDTERLPRLLEELYGNIAGPDDRSGRSLFTDP